MSPLDIALIIFAVGGVWVGMQIGVVSGVFDILGGILGSWAASRFNAGAASFVGGSLSRAYALLFGVVAGSFIAAGMFLSQALERYFLGLIDRFLGALLGVVLSLTLAAAFLFPPLLAQKPSFLQTLHRSSFAPYVMRASQKYLRLTPAPLWEKLEPTLEPPDVYRVRKLIDYSTALGKRETILPGRASPEGTYSTKSRFSLKNRLFDVPAK